MAGIWRNRKAERDDQVAIDTQHAFLDVVTVDCRCGKRCTVGQRPEVEAFAVNCQHVTAFFDLQRFGRVNRGAGFELDDHQYHLPITNIVIVKFRAAKDTIDAMPKEAEVVVVDGANSKVSAPGELDIPLATGVPTN